MATIGQQVVHQPMHASKIGSIDDRAPLANAADELRPRQDGQVPRGGVLRALKVLGDLADAQATGLVSHE